LYKQKKQLLISTNSSSEVGILLLLRFELPYNISYGVSNDFIVPKIGDRVGQLIILPYPKINFIVSEHISETNRGSGGFGSTGN
jgi:hypothetical protein